MRKLTHILFGSGAAIYSLSLFTQTTMAHIIVAILYSILPDSDLKYKHRRIMHNVFSLVFFTIGIYCVVAKIKALGIQIPNTSAGTIAFVGFIAYLTHILLDSITKRGVDLLWPITKRSFGPKLVSSNNKGLNIIFSIVGIMLIILSLIK